MANHSRKRDANARMFARSPRASLIAGPLAVLATASAVSLGVLNTDSAAPSAALLTASSLPEAVSGPATGESTPVALDLVRGLDRQSLSRSSIRGQSAELSKAEKLLRPKTTRRAVRKADTRLFTTEDLNLWSEPGKKARNTGEVDSGEKVLVTGRSLRGREEIVLGKNKTRWVTDGYLSADKPVAEVAQPVADATCSNGTSVSSGVSPNIVKVHAAVCAAFPGISTYGTFRSDGEHAQGIAVDIMVSGDEGYRVAEFVRANAASLGVSYAIYAQRIWSVDRAGEGWRGMSDRGSTTANHYDHVHVTTY
ncbi:MAG: hypothetical protein WB471_02415 [Nocardioides sp.]